MKVLDASFSLKLKYILPEINSLKKKYSNGLCGMVGSNSVFTGGIYFSAMSAMKISADQSHIFAHEESVIPLKCYSPDIIVHNSFSNTPNLDKLKNEARWLKNFSTVLYGPCLGKDDYVVDILNTFVKESGSYKNIINIFDADSLHFFNNLELFNNYMKLLKDSIVILTPNRIEFSRMIQTFLSSKEYTKYDNVVKLISDYKINQEELSKEDLYEKEIEEWFKNCNNTNNNIFEIDLLNNSNKELNLKLIKLYERELVISTIFDNKIIFKKGLVDVITNGRKVYLVSNSGSEKRCGGIGDILGGAISAFTSLYLNKKNINKDSFLNGIFDYNNLIYSDDVLYVCALASYYVKLISNDCSNKKGLSMTASDILETLTKYPIDK